MARFAHSEVEVEMALALLLEVGTTPTTKSWARLCFHLSSQSCPNCRQGWWICRCTTSC